MQIKFCEFNRVGALYSSCYSLSTNEKYPCWSCYSCEACKTGIDNIVIAFILFVSNMQRGFKNIGARSPRP